MFAHRLWLILVISLSASAGLAGTVAPGLETLLQDLDDDELIKVLVVMEDQADIPELDRSLRGAKAALPQRHRQVVESLRDVAQSSQAGLLADLTEKSSSGNVSGFVSHWLINSVVVTADKATVLSIARRPDVARVEPNLEVSLIEPVPGSKTFPPFIQPGGLGLTPNIEAVGAARVWEEFGLDGTGTIVGILDTGVDGTHPALADRWRGNFAPADECWIDASGIGDPSFPVDRDPAGHGTHVMGILTGLAPGDTIGVAPGATWIAANTIIGGIGSLDNAVIASLEFMTDPDGDPTTSDDVPDVVQNSWGVFEALPGYVDCESRWWDLIDNCEAAGVVTVWSAGNEGPYPGTLRSPADRASTPLNSFSVGSTATAFPHAVSEFSSRGPSGCGGDHAIKPEVVAPGESIISAGPGGEYRILSGTSMAGPHVAGVVALMRQANPDLDVASIKEILMDTAVDLGNPGEENAYGHGFIDAFAAVSAVLGNVGTVAGTVTDQSTGLPVAAARIAKHDGYNSVVADADGEFSLTMVAGPAVFQVSRFGYFDNGFSANIVPGATTTHAVFLHPKPTAVISGLVVGPDDLPVAGAAVIPLGIPVPAATTDAAGAFSLTLPYGPGIIYDLECSAPGLGKAHQSVELAADLVVDFELPDQFSEGFETGHFHSWPWMWGGNAPWTIDTTVSHEGRFSARSGTIRNDQKSALLLDYYVSVDSYLQFWTKSSTEYYYDNLIFYLDDVPVAAWSGERDWSQFRMMIPRGHHNFKWVYERDVAYQEGQDAVWLDFIEFPTTGGELFPGIALDVTTIPVSVATGDTVSAPFTIFSVGGWSLDFDIEVGDVLKNKMPSDTLNPKSVAGSLSGGPDDFGYQWVSSDINGGPVYDWVDISVDGLEAGTGDELVLGPFPVGFDFPFYGNVYGAVRISTNGFLTFTSSVAGLENQWIPHPAQPNNLVAVFWDDLITGPNGKIYYKSEPENDRFIVQYDQVRRYDTSAEETFQVILNRDGTILCQYADVRETDSCTVGIENGAGDDGLTVAYLQADAPRNEWAVLFDPPIIFATVDPRQGQLAPGSSVRATVNFDATGLEPGYHVSVMTISSTDPDQPEIIVPLMLTVTEVSAVPETGAAGNPAFIGAVPNPFNPATKLRFSLPRSTEVNLVLYDVSGRRVKSLVAGILPAGEHAVAWNGRDESGRNVASGTYFARLTVDGSSTVKPVTLVR